MAVSEHPTTPGMRGITCWVGLIVSIQAILAVPTLAQWPRYLGPDQTGKSSASDWSADWPAGGPPVRWKKEIGIGYSSMAIADGRCYTLGNTGRKDMLYCFDAASGEVLWMAGYECDVNAGGYFGPRCTPTIADGKVHTLSHEGHIRCWSAEDGSLLWKTTAGKLGGRRPKWGFSGSALVMGDTVVYDLGRIVAMEAATGKVKWSSEDFQAGYSSPRPFERDGETYIAAFPATGLVVLRAADGSLVDRYPWKTSWNVHAVTPIVSGDEIFISSGYRTGCAKVRLTGGKLVEVWRNKDMSNHFNTCVLHEGKLYGFSGNAGGGTLTCMDFATGKVEWTHRGLGTGSLMIAGDRMIILGERGQLVVAPASARGFDPLAEARPTRELCWTVPVLSGGKLYVRDYDKRSRASSLFCLDVSPDPAQARAEP